MVAGMVREEECRRSTTPGTESQRPPQETLAIPVSVGAMTIGHPRIIGGSLRTAHDVTPAGNVYDSWDEDDEAAVRPSSAVGPKVETLLLACQVAAVSAHHDIR